MVRVRSSRNGMRDASRSELIAAAVERFVADLEAGRTVLDAPSLRRAQARQRTAAGFVAAPIASADFYAALTSDPTPQERTALDRDAARILVGDRVRVRGSLFSVAAGRRPQVVGGVGEVVKRWGSLAVVKIGLKVAWIHAYDLEPEVTA